MSRDTIKVAARFRPLNSREKKMGKNQLKCQINELPGGDQVSIAYAGKRQEFSFDYLFQDKVAQELVYERAAKESVLNLFNGYNGTIFAYGQTGSGKTHSMYGPDNVGEHCGIVPRAVLHIFDHMFEKQGSMVEEFSVRCAFCELYNESINDLLDASKHNLAIRESPAKGVYISDLTWEYAGSEADIFDYLELGQRNRKTASTSMNNTSSRSHSIFQLELTQKRMDGTTRVARLNLVDLAGSESVKKTHATGQTFDEAKKINLSLSALGNCIKALTTKTGSKAHIPYRDSKLTRILQESLGGNSKTTLLVCLSPHHDNYEETVSTLRFAQRAKQIVTRAKVNERQSPEMMQKTIEALRRELRNVKAAYDGLTAWLQQNHPSIDVPSKFASSSDDASGGNKGRTSRSRRSSSASSVDLDTRFDDDDALVGKSMTEQVLELQNVRAALQDRASSLESQLSEVREEHRVLKEQFAEATAHLAEARSAQQLAEYNADSKVKRLEKQVRQKEKSHKSLQEQLAATKKEASALRLDAVGAAARNAALQMQMLQMQDSLVLAACLGVSEDGIDSTDKLAPQQQELLSILRSNVAKDNGADSQEQNKASVARSSANDQENAAKVEYLERENETLRKRLQETIATADKVASEAAYKAEIQLAQMDSEVNGLKTDVTKLERKVEGLTKRNKLLEEAAARSTRGLRAGRAVVAVSKRRQSQIRELQKNKKGAGLYSAIKGMLRKTGSPLLSRRKSTGAEEDGSPQKSPAPSNTQNAI